MDDLDAVTVEVDVVDTAGLDELVEGTEVEYRIVEDPGPNGWAVVALAGTRAEIRGVLDLGGYEDPIETYEVKA